MEITVPEGCQLGSIHLKTDSQEVYDRLRAERSEDPTFYESPRAPRLQLGKHVRDQAFFWREADHVVWVDGPARSVKVTVEDV